MNPLTPITKLLPSDLRPNSAASPRRRLHSLTACLCLWGVAAAQEDPAAGGDDPNAGKLEKLRATAQSYVDAYNKGDAAAIAGLYLPDGEINLADGEVVAGRQEIEEFYGEVFAGEKDPQAAPEAGQVRFSAPGIPVEDGILHFQPNCQPP